MASDRDTIAACATAWGPAAVAVVRVSGADARAHAERVAGPLPPPRHAAHRRFSDGAGSFDDGLVVYFPGPGSYTGEDVVELSGHGNVLLVERLLRALGARPARPGEFTRRAFLHGRMDLVRAEAVLAAIAATSGRGVELARGAADGAVNAEVDAVREALTDLAAELEAALDYPGEDLLVPADVALAARLSALATRAASVAASWVGGRIAVEGARVVFAGPVNAGKSSLFNALLGADRAIVAPTPGTTRDVVEATLQLDAVRIVLVDTAGERDSADVIEAEGVARALAARASADLVLRCVPPGAAPATAAAGELVVLTMGDLAPRPGAVSARTGEGIASLRGRIVAALGAEAPGAVGLILVSARQAELFARVAAQLREAAGALSTAGAAVTVELVYASLESVAELDGSTVREGVLDRLFARFCIGK
ncbi:MAG: GTP-binding protein [Myxococcales bacterium]|nr:GTP-binding protein [Myxococcales bacterium]